MQDSDTCILCDQEAETIDHIILGCSFSRVVWYLCLSRLHLQDLVLLQDGRALEWWLMLRKRLCKTLRPAFDSLFFLVGWTLWKERNRRTFDGVMLSPQQVADAIISEGQRWCAAGRAKLGVLLALA